MKKISIIILVLLCGMMVAAQHYVGIGAGIGMPLQMDNLEVTTAKVGVGGNLNMSYMFRRQHFLFTMKIGVGYGNLCQAIDEEELSAEMIDTRGIRFTYLGQLRNRKDAIHRLEVEVPLMVGAEFSQFYFLVGPLFSMPVLCTTHQTALLMTKGDYQGRYYDYVEDMPNHGYHNFEPTQTRGKVSQKIDIRLCAELGYTLDLAGTGRWLSHKLNIGVFAHYGLMNVCQTNGMKLTELSVDKYMTVKMNNIYASNMAYNCKLHNLSAGLRISYLIPFAGSASSSQYSSHRRFYKYKCHCVR